MRRFVLPALVVLVGVSVAAQAYSTGPPAETVVSSNGCTCHSANPNANTVVTVTGVPTGYAVGGKYAITVRSTTDVTQNPVGNKGGFLAWASAGTFAKRTGSEDWYVVDAPAMSNGTHYIEHNGKGDAENSAQEWKFDWTAPAASAGTIKFRVFVNRVNGDGSPGPEDHWNRKAFLVSAPAANSPQPPQPNPNAPPPPPPPAGNDDGGAPSVGLVATVLAIAVAFAAFRKR